MEQRNVDSVRRAEAIRCRMPGDIRGTLAEPLDFGRLANGEIAYQRADIAIAHEEWLAKQKPKSWRDDTVQVASLSLRCQRHIGRAARAAAERAA